MKDLDKKTFDEANVSVDKADDVLRLVFSINGVTAIELLPYHRARLNAGDCKSSVADILREFDGKPVHIHSTATSETEIGELRICDDMPVLFHKAFMEDYALVTTLVPNGPDGSTFRFGQGFVFNGSVKEASEAVAKAGLDAIYIDLDQGTLKDSLLASNTRLFTHDYMLENLTLGRKVIISNMPGKDTDVAGTISSNKLIGGHTASFGIELYNVPDTHTFHVINPDANVARSEELDSVVTGYRSTPVKLEFEAVNCVHVATEESSRLIDQLTDDTECEIHLQAKHPVFDDRVIRGARMTIKHGSLICRSVVAGRVPRNVYYPFGKLANGRYSADTTYDLTEAVTYTKPELKFGVLDGKSCASGSAIWLMGHMSDGALCKLNTEFLNLEENSPVNTVFRNLNGTYSFELLYPNGRLDIYKVLSEGGHSNVLTLVDSYAGYEDDRKPAGAMRLTTVVVNLETGKAFKNIHSSSELAIPEFSRVRPEDPAVCIDNGSPVDMAITAVVATAVGSPLLLIRKNQSIVDLFLIVASNGMVRSSSPVPAYVLRHYIENGVPDGVTVYGADKAE